jgi:hypothetical protein
MLGKEVRNEVETTGLEVGGSVNGGGRRNKEVDGVRRTTKSQRDKSGGARGDRGG